MARRKEGGREGGREEGLLAASAKKTSSREPPTTRDQSIVGCTSFSCLTRFQSRRRQYFQGGRRL